MPTAAPERRLVDATRWNSNADMAEALAKAETMYLANPKDFLTGAVTFDMGRIVGDGYRAGTAEHMAAREVTVRFNLITGKPYTAYPVINPSLRK